MRLGKHGKRAFTLIEMLIVVAIVAILALMAANFMVDFMYAEHHDQLASQVKSGLRFAAQTLIHDIKNANDTLPSWGKWNAAENNLILRMIRFDKTDPAFIIYERKDDKLKRHLVFDPVEERPRHTTRLVSHLKSFSVNQEGNLIKFAIAAGFQWEQRSHDYQIESSALMQPAPMSE